MAITFSVTVLHGQPGPEQKLTLLWKNVEDAENDSVKIARLFSIARFYYDYMGDEQTADSVSEIALDVAVSTYQPNLLVFAYNLYLESNDLGVYYTKSIDYAQKALQYGKNMNSAEANCKSCKNLASVYLAGYQYDKSLEYAFRSLSVADGLDDDKLKAESYLLIGEAFNGKNQAVEAFRNYLNALVIAERLKNNSLLATCYGKLSAFYLKNKVYDKATFYKLRQGDVIQKRLPVDSLALMWMVYDLQVIAVNANSKLSGKFTHNILAYATRHGVNRLKEFEMALYRTYLIKNDKREQLYKLYLEKYPDEYDFLKQKNPALYFTLQAYFYEYQNKHDSAYHSFLTAEQYIQPSPNKILKANFYNRFGQFLLSQKMIDEAIASFSRSYELADQANYSAFMLEAVEQLEVLYADLEAYQDAYKYATLKSELRETLQQASKKSQMIIMEINHEADQRALNEKLQKERVERRHNIQYTGMVIGILAVFLMLIMFGSFRVPKSVIQTLGFFSFIFLFEFIILLADNKIHHWTHGEPWKIMLIKIVLIAILLPFHHWIEKKVVGYLINNRLINFSDFSPVLFLKKMIGIGVDENYSTHD